MLAAQTVNLVSKLQIVLPVASINLKNGEVLTSNAASNKTSFPSFVKVNSDVPTPEIKEHTYNNDVVNFRYRGSNRENKLTSKGKK